MRMTHLCADRDLGESSILTCAKISSKFQVTYTPNADLTNLTTCQFSLEFCYINTVQYAKFYWLNEIYMIGIESLMINYLNK